MDISARVPHRKEKFRLRRASANALAAGLGLDIVWSLLSEICIFRISAGLHKWTCTHAGPRKERPTDTMNEPWCLRAVGTADTMNGQW